MSNSEGYLGWEEGWCISKVVEKRPVITRGGDHTGTLIFFFFRGGGGKGPRVPHWRPRGSRWTQRCPRCQHSPHQAQVKLVLGLNTWSYIWAINCTSMLFCRCCISCSVILLNSSGFLSLILVKQLANFSWLQKHHKVNREKIITDEIRWQLLDWYL